MSLRDISIRESITVMAGTQVDEDAGFSTEHRVRGRSAVDSKYQLKGVAWLHNSTLARRRA